MRGQLDAEESLRVLLHLLPGCPRCQPITADLWWAGAGRGGRIGWRADHGPSIERVFARMRRLHAGLEAERGAARQALAALAGLPVAVWGTHLAREARTWGLCEILLERSREARCTEPRDAETLARWAVEIAGEIPAGVHPAELVENLKGRAWIAVAEARRACADLAGAAAALRRAEAHLARGSGERLEKARLVGSWAALHGAEGRFREADRLLHRSLAVYRRTGQSDLLGRVFLQQGYFRVCAGNLPGAAVSLCQGLALAGAARDPGTAFATYFALACLLRSSGLGALTSQSPATISTKPAPSIQPNRSPRNPAARTAATRGCSVL